MFAKEEKASREVMGNDMRHLSRIISVMEETLANEEKKYDELNIMKEKLTAMESSKAEAVKEIMKEKENIAELRSQESVRVAELIKTKEAEKEREIQRAMVEAERGLAELRSRLKEDADAQLAVMKGEMERSVASRERELRLMLAEEKNKLVSAYHNGVNNKLEEFRSQISSRFSRVQSEISALNSAFDDFFEGTFDSIAAIADSTEGSAAAEAPIVEGVSDRFTETPSYVVGTDGEDSAELYDKLLRLQEKRLVVLDKLTEDGN